MREFLPVLIVGAIIGAFSLVFIMAYIAISKQKDDSDSDRHMKDTELIRRLIHYAKPHWKSFILVFCIMIFSIVYDIVSPLIIGNLQNLVKGEFELPQLYTYVGVYASILVVSMICTYYSVGLRLTLS